MKSSGIDTPENNPRRVGQSPTLRHSVPRRRGLPETNQATQPQREPEVEHCWSEVATVAMGWRHRNASVRVRKRRDHLWQRLRFVLQICPGIIRRDRSELRVGCPLWSQTSGQRNLPRRGSSQTGRRRRASHRWTSEVLQLNRGRQNRWTTVIYDSSLHLMYILNHCHRCRHTNQNVPNSSLALPAMKTS